MRQRWRGSVCGVPAPSAEELCVEFLERYVREVDFYEEVSRLVARRLEAALTSAGIRAIVTSRAKTIARLKDKLAQRFAEKAYRSIEDIYSDIVDLAGVRVALYFPGQRAQVASIVGRLFQEYDSRRVYPMTDATPTSKRFRGYSATHFRVRIREADLEDSDTRYSRANVEIQVASVLMHAWSEVEHDLVYKPLTGGISDRELVLLDQLNGLVETGEIALELLQQAGDARISQSGRPFANQYELASYLLDRARRLEDIDDIGEEGLGHVDLLLAFLKRLDINAPEAISDQVEKLHGDLERRPLSEQIIDLLLEEDPTRYDIYENIRSSPDSNSSTDPLANAGSFLQQWIRLEVIAQQINTDRVRSNAAPRRPMTVSGRLLQSEGLVDAGTAVEVDRLRRLRNMLVHGIEIPPLDSLAAATDEVRRIADDIEARLHSRGEPS